MSFYEKKWRFMKLTLFLFLLGMLRVSASTYAQTYSINLDLVNATRQEAIEAIKKQTDLDFFYSNQEIEARRKVTVACENVVIPSGLWTTWLSFVRSSRHRRREKSPVW